MRSKLTEKLVETQDECRCYECNVPIAGPGFCETCKKAGCTVTRPKCDGKGIDAYKKRIDKWK